LHHLNWLGSPDLWLLWRLVRLTLLRLLWSHEVINRLTDVLLGITYEVTDIITGILNGFIPP